MKINQENRLILANKLEEYRARLATQESKPEAHRLTKSARLLLEHRIRIIETLLDKGEADKTILMAEYRHKAGDELDSFADHEFEKEIWNVVADYNKTGGENLI